MTGKIATKEQAMARIRTAQQDGDTENAHVNADEALCEFLEYLGHGDLVAQYHKVAKWFA